ncbi:MAG: GNAT family N-acetyltransferase [Peptoniphilaceae bacterium]|nr:GNAT family N-acetyltransferase [Peptoniphilaceae bacterium]MDY6018404.1 GNAT family N-acetyltransferase [Anaerococcus sp.]
MKIYEFKNEEKERENLLNYLKTVEWSAAKNLYKAISNNEIKEKFGKDGKIFYAVNDGQIMGFFTLVNQDYIKLPQYDRFIAMVWVDPLFRGRGYARDFIAYAEKESKLDQIHIISQHKGLYEKMGYKLIDSFTDSIHDVDYLYEKNLK